MEVFEILLKKERTRPYRLLAQLILAVNLLFFVMYAVYSSDSKLLWHFLYAALVPLAWWLINRFIIKRKGIHWMAWMLVFIICVHLLLSFWWAALTMVALAGLYRIAMRELPVKIMSSHIEYPSFPRRDIQWIELNNLVLKDGMLTVDFRNNRLAQVEIAQESINREWDEARFNSFCQQQLTAAKKASHSNG